MGFICIFMMENLLMFCLIVHYHQIWCKYDYVCDWGGAWRFKNGWFGDLNSKEQDVEMYYKVVWSCRDY